MRQVPLMLVGDAPDQSTGLSRVLRDLATLLVSSTRFRVATLGVGGRGASEFPWHQYQMYHGEYGEASLPYAWENFCQGEAGIVMTIMDLSRLLWLARPEYVEEPWLKEWVTDARRRKFKLWSYVPIDSVGPGGKLTAMSRETLLGIDRVLAYTPFGEQVVRGTIGEEESVRRGLTWMPHTLNLKVFRPADVGPSPPVSIVRTDGNVGADGEGATVDGLGSPPGISSSEGARGVDWNALAEMTNRYVKHTLTHDLAGAGLTGELAVKCSATCVSGDPHRCDITLDDHQGHHHCACGYNWPGAFKGEAHATDRERTTGASADVGSDRTDLLPRVLADLPATEVSDDGPTGGAGEVRGDGDRPARGPDHRDAVVDEPTGRLTPYRVGVVATNQARKDWGLMALVCAMLVERLKGNVKFWWHVDQDVRTWSIPALIADYGLGEHVELTHPPMRDAEMAERYRACDLTLHPGLGEGFCYPTFESLACGVPALHGDYAGGASILRTCGLEELLIPVLTYRLETQHNCFRPVFEPASWVERALDVMAKGKVGLHEQVAHLGMMAIGKTWLRWFEDGIGRAAEVIE